MAVFGVILSLARALALILGPLALLYVCECNMVKTRPGAGPETDEFFPFGLEHGDIEMGRGDDNYTAVALESAPFVFCGQYYPTVYVSINGWVAFSDSDADELDYTAFCGATEYAAITIFWADVSTKKGTGSIYYRETSDPGLLARVKKDVEAHFKIRFSPVSLFIVTWYKVGFFDSCVIPITATPRNTFQLVMATDGFKSFVYFHFGEMNWFRGDYNSPDPDCLTGSGGEYAPRVGLDQGNNRIVYTIPVSCNSRITTVAETTNTDTPGQWFFRVDTSFEQACPKYKGSREKALAIFGKIVHGTHHEDDCNF